MRHVFRPWFGRVLTLAIGSICLAALVVSVAQGGAVEAVRVGPWLALVAGTCWAAFWRPCVVVDDGGVELVNVLRTVTLPWPSIQTVDTKWALTLVTAYGRYTAWAAPAPGAHGAVRAHRTDLRHLPASTYTAGQVRPGDIPTSPSGEAALLIRQHWEGLRDAGHLDDPRLEHDAAPIRWHLHLVGVAALLAVAGVVGLFV